MDWYHWLAARSHGEPDDKRPAWRVVGGSSKSLQDRAAGSLAAGTCGLGNPLASARVCRGSPVHVTSGNGQC